jgi:hypothetical protein
MTDNNQSKIATWKVLTCPTGADFKKIIRKKRTKPRHSSLPEPMKRGHVGFLTPQIQHQSVLSPAPPPRASKGTIPHPEIKKKAGIQIPKPKSQLLTFN